MRPGFFARFFARFFDLPAKHFRSFVTSTAAAEQPRRDLGASGGPRGGSLEPSGGPRERLGGLGRLLGASGGALGAPSSFWGASGRLLRAFWGPLERSWGLLGGLRKALGALLGDKTRRHTAPRKKRHAVCGVLHGFKAFGRPRAALRKASGGPPKSPGRLPEGAPKRGRGGV